ncbi:methyl-accepting chemotaxis protein [Rhodobacteraceae bacterium D3-12]|nr:methyl-accepting chemotaxis protein [Rhodobacteraceae bacterium D3-12]
MTAKTDLFEFRRRPLRLLAVLTVLASAPSIAVAILLGANVVLFAIASGVLSVIAMAFYGLGLTLPSRLGVSAALVGQCAIFTASFAGHPWQVDSHMAFFAALAVISLLADPIALVFTAAVIAAHHLSLTFLLPALVYPSSDLAGNIGRTMLHSVIVVIETIILVVAAHNTRRRINTIDNDKTVLSETMQTLEREKSTIEAKDRAQSDVVNQLRGGLGRVESGDLTVTLDRPFPNKYEDLRQSFNAAIAALRHAVAEVIDLSGQIRLNSNELAGSSSQIAHSTEEQSKAVGDISASINEISSTMQAASLRTSDTQSRFQRTLSSTTEGAQAFEQALDAMRAIETSSGEINNIVALIEDISFQTNLLALNAGVEASRAGKAGAGFAIVASEVRALAHRSSEAAKSINALIQQSKSQVVNGTSLVSSIGDTLGQIVDEVKTASDNISEVASVAEEQSQSVARIQTAISTLEHVTQSNAARSEESHAATVELDRVVDTLFSGLQEFAVADASTSNEGQLDDNFLAPPPAIKRTAP